MRLVCNAIVESNNNPIGKIMMPHPMKMLLLCCALALPAAHADELLIEAIQHEPPNSPEGIPRPTRGMSMDQVRQRFGDPIKAHPWVGDPPITRWDYDKFSVFFEYQTVLDTVIHRN